MKNFEILEFIYNRMLNVHSENPNYDYMIRFKNIIETQKANPNKENERFSIPDLYSLYEIFDQIDQKEQIICTCYYENNGSVQDVLVFEAFQIKRNFFTSLPYRKTFYKQKVECEKLYFLPETYQSLFQDHEEFIHFFNEIGFPKKKK